MTISKKLKKFLSDAKIDYQILEHDPAYTALETAQAQHVPGRQLVKVVLAEADGKNILCVLSAVQKIDFQKLKTLLKVREIVLADEKKMAALFPEYEVGAEPPFASSPEMPVYVDKLLEENDSIVFNGGTHVDLVRIKFKDYVTLAKPQFAEFGTHL